MQVMRRVLQRAGLSVVVSGLLCSSASATDRYPQTAIPADGQALPAVDGLNAKASGFGGAVDGRALYGGEGSVSLPLGYRYGLQIDGLIAGFDSEFQGDVTTGGTAAHLFWRNPSVGLLGLYGHYLHADAFGGVDVYAGAGEGALYLGRFTLEGVAGVEDGDVDAGTLGGLRLDIDTRFFDVAQLAYYPIDNLRLSVGQAYVLGENAGLFGAEWGFGSGATMGAVYANGAVFEGGDAAVLGGLRVYFGQSGKTLIRRHREDDPGVHWTENYTIYVSE